MHMIVSGQKIDIDAVELQTVKVIVGKFIKQFREICNQHKQPTMYWTFLIHIHSYTGLLLQQLDADVFAADMNAINQQRRRQRAEKAQDSGDA